MRARFLIILTSAFFLVIAFAMTTRAQALRGTLVDPYAAGGIPGANPKPSPKPKPSPTPGVIDGETDWKNTAGNTDWNTGASWTAVTGSAPPAVGDVAWFKAARVTNPNISGSTSVAGLYFNGNGTNGYTISASACQT